jgi:hypothetical protein
MLLEVLERVRFLPTSSSLTASSTTSSAPSSTSSSPSSPVGEWDMTFRSLVDGDLGDLRHQISRDVFHVRLNSSRVQGSIMTQISKVQRVGSEMGL